MTPGVVDQDVQPRMLASTVVGGPADRDEVGQVEVEQLQRRARRARSPACRGPGAPSRRCGRPGSRGPRARPARRRSRSRCRCWPRSPAPRRPSGRRCRRCSRSRRRSPRCPGSGSASPMWSAGTVPSLPAWKSSKAWLQLGPGVHDERTVDVRPARGSARPPRMSTSRAGCRESWVASAREHERVARPVHGQLAGADRALAVGPDGAPPGEHVGQRVESRCHGRTSSAPRAKVACTKVIGVCVSPGPAWPASVAGDDAHQRAAVGDGEQRDVARPRCPGSAGRSTCSAAGRLTHSWIPWNRPPEAISCVRRPLDVQDPAPGGHPLRGAVLDDAAAADGVLVLEGAVDHVGDRLEAAVGVPGRALGLARAVVDLAHLVHVDEGVEVAPGRCPAKARRTGKPSPSRPRGAVVTDFTGRSVLRPGRGGDPRAGRGCRGR